MASKSHKCAYLAICGYRGPKWVEQSGTRVEQLRGHMGRWAGDFFPLKNCHLWDPGGLKMASKCHKCAYLDVFGSGGPFVPGFIFIDKTALHIF